MPGVTVGKDMTEIRDLDEGVPNPGFVGACHMFPQRYGDLVREFWVWLFWRGSEFILNSTSSELPNGAPNPEQL